ncbi:Carboxypeptidase regulatory-like domain-containing protein [Sanguibacter gelidistatuariae]|uniref:Carboxypeptidase regulatory-like domain-containing protein n=1 Tax=Sanguibacter gelidistatuariae TaxID=1814289 RepID=A0A1G6MW23_9MICO|nr:carboxypeptidase-like regulatory domain-containing protein [Sanguibacter gelidistatuariae]SDC59722.1 Carboxypeptidase regulatory-like domain-containing protein [Sanguibacter gelidistatuariae]
MRILSTVALLEVSPGESVDLVLDVVNTEPVIEGVTARVIGMPATMVRAQPASLALFPDAQGEITLTFAVPGTFPAGRHPLTIEVCGSTPAARPVHHDVELVVAARPRMVLRAAPSMIRARKRGTFRVETVNRGNVPLDVALRARDSDRSLNTTITPSALTVAPGEAIVSTIVATGPRHVFGSDLDRPLKVEATTSDVEDSISLMLRQRPLISRGLLTVAILVGILVVWAAIFLFGIRNVLGSDPVTKVAPASFFAASAASGTAGASPAGALSKDGVVEAGVGGTLTGTVTAQSDLAGVGLITVDALRMSRTGMVVVSSAATQSDGTFTIAGLFPGRYYLRIGAEGYDTLWYPATPTETGATTVRARAQEVSDPASMVVTGHPASLSGTVEVGDVLTPVVTTVVARPAWSGADETLEYTTEATGDGTYTLADLPAPGTYELTFTAEGYQPATARESLVGGQSRFVSDVRLGSTPGQISGMVTDGVSPLGGVVVSTTLDGRDITVGTPTLGVVGSFVIPGLTTPGTYVVTFAKEGFGDKTVVVDLTAGQSRGDLVVSMADGVGTLTGRLVDGAGKGLGGAAISVGGGTTSTTATTLTSGDVGAFTIAGLASPGSYTLTFTLSGYQPQSVPVDLAAGEAAAPIRVTMTAALGSITGQVTTDRQPVLGTDVVITNGAQSWTTVTSSEAGSAGIYTLSGLAPGTYTVTVSLGGMVRATGLATVAAGASTTRNLETTGAS